MTKEEPKALTKLEIAKNIASIDIGKKEEHISDEAKQRAKNYMSLKGALEPKQIKCYCGHTTYCDCGPLEEPKQETLEEATKNWITKNSGIKSLLTPDFVRESFVEGAKWQKEKSYSEEELISFAHFYFQKEFNSTMQTSKSTDEIFKEWFEQFKKK